MERDLFSTGNFGVSRVRMSTLDVRLCAMTRELGGPSDLAELRARLVAIAMRVNGSAWHAPIVAFVIATYQYAIGLASERLGEGLRFPLSHPTSLERMLAEATVRGDFGLRKNLAKLALAIGEQQIMADRAA